MFGELTFRSGLVVLSILLASIRFYYGRLSIRTDAPVVLRRAGGIRTVLVWLFGGSAAAASALWVVMPAWLEWAALPLPAVLRWVGIGLGGVTVVLFYWVHRALGNNWAMPGEIKEQQTLVTEGPYRWVRHPMYMTLFVWALAYWLISANSLVGITWLGLSLVAATMVADEEAALIETFGEAYRDYMRRVPPF